jgi:signal transduction histidine kinase/ActR/RegA family two-component response regulator
MDSDADQVNRVREKLIDPAIWRPMLEKYAAATSLAVALTDRQGRILGECINPRPLWSLLRERIPAKPGDCPFCIRPISAEDCAMRFINTGSRALAAGYGGLVHFTVPLTIDKTVVGFLLAGQVENRYPEQLHLLQVAKDSNISSQSLLQTARGEIPVSDRTLHVYWDLLETFADSFLKTHLHSLLETQRLEELKELDRRKDEFLATLSHELRTPLTAIVGWIRFLRSGSIPTATLEQALEVIDRNATVQTQLVDDLLEVSRFITGKIQLNIARTDLVVVINAAVDSVRPSAQIKNISIQVALDTGARIVNGDSARLQQVLWNLLTNSLKFTPAGGRIDVRLERVESSARIVVSDTGEGIKNEFLSSIFDRFTQADASPTRHYGGLGLGLAIVRQLVELHGGSVTAYSAGERQGTTVYVTLPLAPADVEDLETPESSPEISAAAPSRTLHGVRVLVVEDEKDTRDLLKELLESEGAIAVPTESVRHALEVMNEQTFDVIVADIAMPDGDGYQLIEAIRRLPPERGSRTPAIALTAFAGQADRRRLLDAGFQTHMAKPFSPDELTAAISDLIRLQQRRAS